MSLPTDAEIAEGIRRIALTSDGMLLYRRLQMLLMEVPAATDAGALYENKGRRSLARELKLLMDEELAKRATASDRPSGPHDPDRPAISRGGSAVSLNTGRGSARRVEPYADDGKPARGSA